MAEVLDRQDIGQKLNILNTIQRQNGYDIEKIENGYAKVHYTLENAQHLEKKEIVYEADIYDVANFTALIAVNEQNCFTISSAVDFLSQIEHSDKTMIFEANVISSSMGKKYVEVQGTLDDIVLFMGNFTILKLDNRSRIKV